MSIVEAVILGAVQGITEFLPVSSSGHLVLLQKILNISEPALLFDTVVHGGTLLAVLAVLWKDVRSILRCPFQALTGLLILGTIPAVIAALFFGDAVEAAFSSAAFLGWAFLITAAALFCGEALSRRRGLTRLSGRMSWLDALIIGIAQAVAIIPGVSRSGLTLSASLSRKLERSFAARFSFLLSIPAILGALVLQVKDLSGKSSGISGAALAAGTLTAALVGFFSIKIMLRIIRSSTLRPFAFYTAVLGILVLIDQNFSHFFF